MSDLAHSPLDDDVKGHRLAGNDNETVVEDRDVEGHRLAQNDNESIVED